VFVLAGCDWVESVGQIHSADGDDLQIGKCDRCPVLIRALVRIGRATFQARCVSLDGTTFRGQKGKKLWLSASPPSQVRDNLVRTPRT
jgi:hypothetical protein